MKRVVTIDGHNLALQRGTGVATYAKNLADNISEMGWGVQTLYGAPLSHRMPEFLREVSFFDYIGGISHKKSNTSELFSWMKEILTTPFGHEAVNVPVTGKVEARRFSGRLPRESAIFNAQNLFGIARRYFQRHKSFLKVRLPVQPDIMHWTYPLPIKVEGIPNVYTIHDLVPLRLPYTTLDNKRYYYRLIRECVNGGGHICTVSEKSKTDIVQLFGVSEQEISNTYQAVETTNSSHGKSQHDVELEVEGIYGLAPRSYFLFFGAIEPKKNVGRLIEAFLSVRLDATLVVVGAMAWKSDEEMKLVNSMLKQRPDIRRRIRIFDYVPRPFLISLIRSAKAVVFPSLYEGFGLPVLEAMQLGTPTLCSAEGSLPEIAGGASLIVDPYDVGSIAKGLRILDHDDDLRHELSRAGLERAKMFNSASYKGRLLSMYEKIIVN